MGYEKDVMLKNNLCQNNESSVTISFRWLLCLESVTLKEVMRVTGSSSLLVQSHINMRASDGNEPTSRPSEPLKVGGKCYDGQIIGEKLEK